MKYNVKSHIMHSDKCHILNRTASCNIQKTEDVLDLYAKKYRYCKVCNSISRLYSKDKEYIEEQISNNKYKFENIDGVLHVSNDREDWLIVAAANSLILFHKSINRTFKYMFGDLIISYSISNTVF